MLSTPPAWARRARAALVVLAGAAAGLVAAAPASAQRGGDPRDQVERPEVREVRILGTRALPRDEIAEALATKASACKGLLYRFTACPFTKSPAVYERRYLDQLEFERDVVRLLVFYYKRGWRDAQVDTAVTRAGPSAVRVTFTVREGAPTRTVAVRVDDATNTLRPRDLARLLTPKAGEPFNTIRLDSAVVRVREEFWDRGYSNAEVARPAIAVDDTADTASARLAVRRGPLTPVSRIDVLHVGARRTVKDETIRNALSIEPGDLFRRKEVARSQRALYETGLFRSALIDTAVATQAGSGETVCASQGTLDPRPAAAARAGAGAGDSSKALVVCVVEAPLREARTSVGLTTSDFLQVEGRYTHNYFLGGSRRFTTQAVVGNLGARGFYQALPQNVFNNPFKQVPGGTDGRFFLPTYNVGVDVQQRDVGSPRNTLGAGVFASRRLSPGVFVDQGQGANLSFTRLFGERTPVSLTYRFELNKVQAGDVYFCVNFGVCDGPTIGAVSSARRLAPLALTASSVRTDNALSPTRGFITRATVEHASGATLSEFRYNRATAELSYYRPAPFVSGVTLATRVRGGFVRAIGRVQQSRGLGGVESELLHPRTRFYAGGAQSVRGYGENQLGPRVLTVAPDVIRGRAIRNNDTTYAVNPDSGGTAECGLADAASLRTCFAVRRDSIGDGSFSSRPLGGTALVELNVEARFPIWRQLFGAVFVDAGVLGERSLRDLSAGTRTVTPGFGVRYRSPVGPVRVDLGIRPTLRETLPVITQTSDSVSGNRLLDLTAALGCESGTGSAGCRQYPQDNTSGIRGLVRRLVLHLSIGEAF